MQETKNGITLIALVITIVILIILAVVAIGAVFGEGGLIDRANYGKKESEKADAREQLELVLADAYVEKNINEEYNQDEFLDDFIYERKPEAEVMEEEISLNGYTFELDRSVPRLGDYIGEAGNLPATIRKINVTNKTLSEVSVEVITARTEGVEYRYSYKKEVEEDSSYKQVAEKEENTNTYSGLESQVVYNLKVELIKDGDVIDEEVVNVMLGEIEEGSLTFGKESWSNGTASLPVSTTTNMQIQYQINGIEEGSWTTIENNGSIPNIPNGADVYARLWDGTNGSEYISRRIEDMTPPEITSFEAKEIKGTSITVEVVAKDEESGLSSAETYQYYLENELKEKSEKNNYIFAGLDPESEYEIKVIVKNGAGMTIEKNMTVETTEVSVEELLAEGVYVNYVDTNNVIRKCVVLYDSSSEYGIEIITMDTVEDVILGDNDPTQTGSDKAKYSYNAAIKTLNSRASFYNNSSYSTLARCVGSVPNDINSQGAATDYYGNSMRNGDNNYLTDWNKMTELNIYNIGKTYWLASRNVFSRVTAKYYCVRYVDNDILESEKFLRQLYRSGPGSATTRTNGLRIVFHLNSEIKIVGGKGTDDSPYELGI